MLQQMAIGRGYTVQPHRNGTDGKTVADGSQHWFMLPTIGRGGIKAELYVFSGDATFRHCEFCVSVHSN